jgi:hypothetical protein
MYSCTTTFTVTAREKKSQIIFCLQDTKGGNVARCFRHSIPTTAPQTSNAVSIDIPKLEESGFVSEHNSGSKLFARLLQFKTNFTPEVQQISLPMYTTYHKNHYS